MVNHDALLLEFAARKEQVLNLETRLFVLVLVLEAFFLVAFVLYAGQIRQNVRYSLGCASVYFLLLFELIAVNGKMGLISMYLRQMEVYLASHGHAGVVWESRALDRIIFRPGNAFTLPAALAILLLLVQAIYVIHLQMGHISRNLRLRLIVTVILGAALVFLVAKTITVDFYAQVPQVFGDT